MLKIGLTGGIGSGKTTIARIVESMDYPVYFSDDRAKELITENPPLIQAIKQVFGADIYSSQNKLDKKKLANIVFENKDKLIKLNNIVHPAVENDFEKWMKKQTSPIVFKEAAILFETGNHKKLDATILVTAPKTTRIKRVMERDNTTKEAVENRMKNQWSDNKKMLLADFIIENNDQKMVIPQILAIIKKLEGE